MALFHRLRATQLLLDRSELESVSSLKELEQARIERQALITALASVEYSGNFLSGNDVTSGVQFRARKPSDGIYYVIDSQCGACFAGQPFIDSVATGFPGSATVISFVDSESDLRAYTDSNKITYRALIHPGGYLAQIVPRHATPITAVVLAGKLQSLIVGVPSAEDRRAIRLALAPPALAKR